MEIASFFEKQLQTVKDKKTLASIHNKLGDLYRENGQFERAIQHHAKELNLSVELHGARNHVDISKSHRFLGIAYMKARRMRRAINHHKLALKMAQDVKRELQQKKKQGSEEHTFAWLEIERAEHNLGTTYYEWISKQAVSACLLRIAADFVCCTGIQREPC